MKYTPFYNNSSFNFAGQMKSFSSTLVMGILNLTPDSFYSNSRVSNDEFIDKSGAMIEAGVDIIDIGGYSSRPGADEISEEEELKRVIKPISSLKKFYPECLISIDTFRSKVALEAVNAGASMINDISGGEADKNMFKLVADLHVPYVLMHMRGNPKTMQKLTSYDDLIAELILFFSQKIDELNQLGVHDVIIDPGFGFSKTIDQNFQLLNCLDQLHILKKPILAGLSRKSFVYKTLGIEAKDALTGSLAVNLLALQQGVEILRVHDVKETKELVKLVTFMQNQ